LTNPGARQRCRELLYFTNLSAKAQFSSSFEVLPFSHFVSQEMEGDSLHGSTQAAKRQGI
jgi:hypothetical protein